MNDAKEFIADCWNGRVKLWLVFWIYGLLLGFILELIIEFILPENTLGAILGLTIILPWAIWNTVSQWRCAFNTEFEFFGYLVRGLLIIGILLIPISLTFN